MEYLSRGDAPFSETLWKAVDSAVVSSARELLVGRRFLPLYGPVGGGVRTAVIDKVDKEEQLVEGFATFTGRSAVQLPQLVEDFWLYWRDLQAAEQEGRPVDLSAAHMAAQKVALREDEMIFYGVTALGIEGLLTAKGAKTQKRKDWSSGENSFTDIAAAMSTLRANGCYGRHTLLVSSDVYVELQRIVPGTGVMESERIEKLLDGRVYTSPVLKPKTAALFSAESYYMDLYVGQDFATAFTEAVDLNYHLRVLETALPRIKAPQAIILFS